jgi:hypothetical protein
MPNVKPNQRIGWATNGNRMTPKGGKLIPLKNRNMVTATAKENLLVTSSLAMRIDRAKNVSFWRS